MDVIILSIDKIHLAISKTCRHLSDMKSISQSPTDPIFVQNPYAFYAETRESCGNVFYWDDYAMPCVADYATANALFRDRRLGREIPLDQRVEHPPHQAGFWAIEDHSMLELEAPRHTRLRGLVLRAFTSRRIRELAPEITALAHDLCSNIDADEFDIIKNFSEPLPILIISKLLGVPASYADDMVRWSHAMVGMYQAGRTIDQERAAADAATEFATFLKGYIDHRRTRPADDLITSLIAAEEDGEKLSPDELIATCILLMNAGHEATVHTIANGVKTLLETDTPRAALAPDAIDQTVEEILRYDPPLHMFTRYVYEDSVVNGHSFAKGDKVAILLGAANRDPARWDNPDVFDPTRKIQPNTSFGAGAHFCIGAPLARLEMACALPVLFEHFPNLRLAQTPEYAPIYHFHGQSRLMVRR